MHAVFRKLCDGLACFLLFLASFFNSLFPPLTLDRTKQQACLWTLKTLLQFHWLPGAATLWDDMWEWKRGGGCAVEREVWTDPSQITQWKNNPRNNTRQEQIKALVFLFVRPFCISLLCRIFLFIGPHAFCSFILPFGGSHLSSLIVKTPAFQWLSCTLAKL